MKHDHETNGFGNLCNDGLPVLEKIHELYHDLLNHDGFGEMRVEIRILKRGQKEVIVHCGKQYRFIVDVPRLHGQAQRRNNELSINKDFKRKEV